MKRRIEMAKIEKTNVMNKIKISALYLFLLAPFLGVTQENQNVLSEKFGDGVITSYTMTSCCSEKYTLVFSEFDGKKMFEISENGSPREPEKFYVDEEGFPVTFIKGSPRGNKADTERLKVITYDTEERIVFLGEWVYWLENWKSKDDYRMIMAFAPGDISGLKAIKAAAGAGKKMKAANHQVVLQNYLDEAFAKQAEVLKVWNVENAELIQRRIDNDQIMTDEINQKNAAYWESEEGQAIIRRNNKDKPGAWVTLKNTRGERVYIMNEGGTGSWLASGGESRFLCSNNMYYALEDEGGNYVVKGGLIYTKNSGCGETVEVK